MSDKLDSIVPARFSRVIALGLGLWIAAATVTVATEVSTQPAPLAIKSRLEPLVDEYLIGSMHGVRLKLHEPRSMGTVMVFDRPWEGVTSAYVTVFKDGDIFRMYYRGSNDPDYTLKSELRPGEQVLPAHPIFTCYAESRDGISWTRPSLGLFEFNGSKDNNIIWNSAGAENFGPFRDDNPAVPAAERYKAVGSDTIDKRPVLIGFVSADGKQWKKIQDKPVLTDGKFDSLNVVFWDAVRGQYTAIYRDFVHGVRTIKYASSTDFLHWTPGRLADFEGAPPEHLYTNATVPYFRAPQIYFAMPRRFMPWKTYFKGMEATDPGVSDALFMSSRDGVHWRRFEEAFIRPGLDERNWAHRSNTPVRGFFSTGRDEISIFVERNYTFPSNQVERLTLRTDGFVSANAGSPGGELVTKPLTFTGSQLVLNYSTSANGSIRIEIDDLNGQPIPGFYLEDSPVIFGDKTAQAVAWRHARGATDRDPLARLAGMPIRLRFAMRDADLYSLQFK